MTISLLHNKQFLADYWQKKPLFIENAFPESIDWLEADELAGLSCEEAVESRVVRSIDGSWRSMGGPFDDSFFKELPESDWVLLVQAVDQWVPELRALLDRFRFLPSWRLDDIMVSYSPPGGTVSPHFDYYDVFLIQGEGQRRWQLGENCTSETALEEGVDIKTLKSFSATQEYLMNPGDMLYVPAGLAHYGVSIDHSMTYSVGFRSPSLRQAVDGIASNLVDLLSEDQRYRDTLESLQSPSGEIPATAVEAIRSQIVSMLTTNVIVDWFGKEVSSPKYPEWMPDPVSEDWRGVIASGGEVFVSECSRISYFRESGSELCTLFADGESISAPLKLAEAICNGERHLPLELLGWLKVEEAEVVLDWLFELGALRFD